ncbi:GHMP kinase [Hoeflea sp.]|uniref:GHMP family kinase ATP-binding protein n=1 Tax=Hoeflea sp. TaxID=1940281 RepID=UPI003B521ACA
MIYTTRTPLRVSFFGGGTDYPEYFNRHPGAVVGMAIDKYIYIGAVRLGGIQPYRIRLSYSKLETVQSVDEIQHPVMREVLKLYGIDEPIDISIMSDMPANTGLGSSSAFTVGFLNVLHSLTGRMATKMDLAREAMFVERDVLKENVGVQDQLHASFGGLNRFDFSDGKYRVTPLLISAANLEALNNSLYLIYTGDKRHASKVVEKQLEETRSKSLDKKLDHLLALTDQAVDVLENTPAETMVVEIGKMLHEGWMTKRSLTSSISSPHIDALYETALANGALGGKLAGAGGGGFLLMIIPPENLEKVRSALAPQPVLSVSMDARGSTAM